MLNLNDATKKIESTSDVSDDNQATPLTVEEFQRLSQYVYEHKLEMNNLSISEVRTALEYLKCDEKKTKQVFDYLKLQG